MTGGENIDKNDFWKLMNFTLKYLSILTHGHGDHIAGINRLIEECKCWSIHRERRCSLSYWTRIEFDEIYRSKFCFNGESSKAVKEVWQENLKFRYSRSKYNWVKKFYCPEAKMLISLEICLGQYEDMTCLQQWECF